MMFIRVILYCSEQFEMLVASVSVFECVFNVFVLILYLLCVRLTR